MNGGRGCAPAVSEVGESHGRVNVVKAEDKLGGRSALI